ncbi:MAG: AAA family ATPase [Candidatus Symbiothrix sp.]|jgi:AAA+ ATPase superfamily predicted ATPase|nr:AAA family ATPase [Candidatus Symbiothrix sp.]
MELLGRKKEQIILQQLIESEKSEFVALYGRRRVGKTFLVKEFFKNNFSFYISGLQNSNKKGQLQNFNTTLSFYGKMPYPKVNSWIDAFRQLIHLLEHSGKRGKKVVFIDELPWFDTARSGFLTAIDFFWNAWASGRNDILLIVCGSATSWIINKLLNNRGGLYNRVTRRMHISPFTLSECKDFFRYKKMPFDRKSIIDAYMIFGGIPYYLEMFQKRLSVAQNIDNLLYKKDAPLKNEFSFLYASLFKNYENHLKIVEALSRKTKGLTRDEIIVATKIPNGGGLSVMLEELEQCDFIRRYQSFGKKEQLSLYQLIDFYSLFYFNFLKNSRINDEQFWTNFIDNARRRAWSGYAFEQVCLIHLPQIKQKLGISGVLSNISSWRSNDKENGAQIDLLIERNDNIVNLCEMKYASEEFVIDKKLDENLRNKRASFKNETKTRKTIHLTMITTYGIKHTEYRNNIQSEVTMDDLFK